MITLDFSYKEVKPTHTFELTCLAIGGNTFVKDDTDTFLNIASPADMILIPDVKGSSLYRDDTITLIFRDSQTREFTEKNIREQVTQLNNVTLTDQTDQVLYSKL